MLTSAIDKTAHTGTGAPAGRRADRLALRLRCRRRSKGLAVDVRLKGDQLAAAAYTPELPAQVPADVSVFVDFKGLDTALAAADAEPGPEAAARRGRAGCSAALLDEVIALFKGEGAVYVRHAAERRPSTRSC